MCYSSCNVIFINNGCIWRTGRNNWWRNVNNYRRRRNDWCCWLLCILASLVLLRKLEYLLFFSVHDEVLEKLKNLVKNMKNTFDEWMNNWERMSFGFLTKTRGIEKWGCVWKCIEYLKERENKKKIIITGNKW